MPPPWFAAMVSDDTRQCLAFFGTFSGLRWSTTQALSLRAWGRCWQPHRRSMYSAKQELLSTAAVDSCCFIALLFLGDISAGAVFGISRWSASWHIFSGLLPQLPALPECCIPTPRFHAFSDPLRIVEGASGEMLETQSRSHAPISSALIPAVA